MRLVYVCESDSGGIAEYALRQAPALVCGEVDLVFVCRPTFQLERLARTGVEVLAILPSRPRPRSRFGKLADRIRDQRRVAKIVSDLALKRRTDAVLLACYSEYFSPFWAPIYRKLAKRGIPTATIAHDPVRDFVFGPLWWHRWSVRQGYSFVSKVFVHDDTPVDFGGAQLGRISVHQIPHGPFELAPPRVGREAMRERLGFDVGDRVFLSFGQIRDGKNLDRFLRILPSLPPEVKLWVAGSGGGNSGKPPEFYQDLARELGVESRCRWDIRYIPDEETGDLFASADVILMGYSSAFRSASGVLNSAVSARRPVLTSSGPGPLRTSVREYDLGVFVEPDDDQALASGVREILANQVVPQWERYEGGNSWEENARRVVAALSGR